MGKIDTFLVIYKDDVCAIGIGSLLLVLSSYFLCSSSNSIAYSISLIQFLHTNLNKYSELELSNKIILLILVLGNTNIS